MKNKINYSKAKPVDDYRPDTRPISPCDDDVFLWEKNTQCYSLMFERFVRGEKLSVLDLSGFASQGTIDAVKNHFKLYFQVIDLKEKMDEAFADPKNTHITQSSFSKLLNLPHPVGHRIDVILLWDIFCYMSKDSIIELMDYLALYCRPGSMIYYLNHTSDLIGEKPGQYSFKVKNDQALLRRHVDNDSKAQLQVPSFRYSTSQLSQMMPSYEVIKYYMPQNVNIIEHLGCFEKYTKPTNLGTI